MSSTKERSDLEDLTRKSLAVQWLGLRADAVKGGGSNPGLGTKILQAMWGSQIKKKKITVTDQPRGQRPVVQRGSEH